jgi:hypothetical protein
LSTPSFAGIVGISVVYLDNSRVPTEVPNVNRKEAVELTRPNSGAAGLAHARCTCIKT